MGTSGAPYNLPWPEDGDIADVPADMQELVTALVIALNLKLTESTANGLYQNKIRIETVLPAASSLPEGTIVFLVP